MGVKGLDSFIQQNKWGEEIDLKQFTQQHFEKTGEVIEFAIDGGSVSDSCTCILYNF